MNSPEFKSVNKKDLSISLAAANLYSIPLMILPLIIFGIPYYILWEEKIQKIGRIDLTEMLILFLIYAAGIVSHELIHGFFWIMYGKKKWREIKFGFNLKTLTPYIHCAEPIESNAYKIGTAAPGIILGILPSLFSIISGNVWIFLFGLLFSVSAGGDFIILWIIRRVDSSVLVEDHPSRAGCFVYADKDMND